MRTSILRAGLLVLLAVFLLPSIAYAQHTSPNYQVDEVFIGSGGELEACSGQYCSQQSVGGTGGESSSNNYGIMAGFGTPDEPTLSVIVNNDVIDLGVLSTSSTSASSTNFSVSNYLSNGYVVKVNGSAPNNVSGPKTHTLTALNAPNPSQPGTEQFGINLVSNSEPGIGVNPVQAPDNSFAYGIPSRVLDIVILLD